MRLHIKNMTAILLFAGMLICPQRVFEGASKGLLLWFYTVLPALFPFLLLGNLLLITGNIRLITSVLGGICNILFGTSENGSFVVLTGFLCGYPMGAKMTADLTASGYLTQNEGRYLLSFCNNTSPSFIINFLVLKTLNKQALILPTFLILTFSSVIISFFTRRLYHTSKFQNHTYSGSVKEKKNWSMQELDDCIMDSFATLLKVGGYIIFFSVILSLLSSKNAPPWFTAALSLLEVTNGLVMLDSLHLGIEIRYPLMLALTAFGGICSVAQTQCMVRPAGYRIFPYIMQKLAAALTASLLGTLYLRLF